MMRVPVLQMNARRGTVGVPRYAWTCMMASTAHVRRDTGWYLHSRCPVHLVGIIVVTISKED